MQIRRLIAATLACAAVVFGVTFLVGSGRAQAGQRQVNHTCSAPDRQFLSTVSTNMFQLAYWSDSLVHHDVAPGVVVKQARAEAAQVDATRPTDPTFERARGLHLMPMARYGIVATILSRLSRSGASNGSTPAATAAQ